MAQEFTLTLTGDKQLDRFFRTMPTRVQKKVVRKPLRDAAKLIQTAAKENAPERTGLLRRAIKVRAAKRSRRFPFSVTVRPQIGAGDFKGKTFYGAFVEFGHRLGLRRNRAAIKRGIEKDSRPVVEGQHFMERAFESKAQQAKQVALSGIRVGIEAEARLGSH